MGGSLQTFDLSKYEDSYTTIINRMKEEFIKLRAGRLDATFFTHIYAKVGTENLPVSQLAQINVKNANTCIVSPFASENIDAIEKGLKVSETGFDITRTDKSLTVSQNGSTAKELKEKLIVKTRKITQDRKEDLKVQRSKSQ